jgi:hypothetical protein
MFNMPFKAIAPAGEKFYLNKTDKYAGITEEADRTFVVIREATNAEDRQRLPDEAREVVRTYRQAEMGGTEMDYKRPGYNKDRAVIRMIWLVLTDSNLEDGYDAEHHPIPLFRFKQDGSIRRVDMTEEQFTVAIDKLHGFIVDEIFEKVIIKNPTWGDQTLGE